MEKQTKKVCLEFLTKVDEKNKAREREKIQKKGYTTEEKDTLNIFERGVDIGWICWAKENPEVREALTTNMSINPNNISKSMNKEEYKKYAVYIDFLKIAFEREREKEARRREEKAKEELRQEEQEE